MARPVTATIAFLTMVASKNLKARVEPAAAAAELIGFVETIQSYYPLYIDASCVMGDPSEVCVRGGGERRFRWSRRSGAGLRFCARVRRVWRRERCGGGAGLDRSCCRPGSRVAVLRPGKE